MTTKTRTCSNCASLNRAPSAGEPLCWNLIGIDQADVAAGCVCDQHISPEEDAVETDMVGAYHRLGCEWAVQDYLQSCALARRAVEKARHL